MGHKEGHRAQETSEQSVSSLILTLRRSVIFACFFFFLNINVNVLWFLSQKKPDDEHYDNRTPDNRLHFQLQYYFEQLSNIFLCMWVMGSPLPLLIIYFF